VASHSIGGGVVQYRDIAWLECPDRPDIIGECTSSGSIDILWNGRVMESFRIRVGDPLLVADGATIAPGTWLVGRSWSLRVRADLPHGENAIVHWSDAPFVGATDDVTGEVRLRFPPGDEAVTLDLVDDRGRISFTRLVPRNAAPTAKQGDVVTRGDVLASISDLRLGEGMGGIEYLQDFLNGRVCGRTAASIAPCDGRVEAIEPRCVTVRGTDGSLHRVRRRRGSHSVRTYEGDDVRAGDALEWGVRSHHHLLRVWGEARLSRHMLDELELETARRSLPIARTYWALVIRTMLGWRRVLDPGDTGLRRHRVLSRQAFERAQRETLARGLRPATAAPVLRGIAAMARERLDRTRV
jgi:hypothetical protein